MTEAKEIILRAAWVRLSTLEELFDDLLKRQETERIELLSEIKDARKLVYRAEAI